MGNRYGQRDDDRDYDNRDRWRDRRPGYSGSRTYDREQNYFGSGGQSYGGGYSGTDRERGYGSYSRGSEEGSSYGSDSWQRGRGSDYSDRNRQSGYYGSSDNDDRTTGAGRYGGYRGSAYGGYYAENYPESERGYLSNGETYGDRRGWWDRASDEISAWFGDEEAERRREWDARREGTHRGRGPKNYLRSDDRIEEDINDRLTYDSFVDASNIEVGVESGEVTLTGTVTSRYAKRRAEDLADSCSGVKNVENRLRVTTSEYGSTSSSGLTSMGSLTSGTTAADTSTETGRSKSA